jgi:signal transduction histidine kinase
MKLKDSIYIRIAFGYVILVFPFAVIFSFFYYAVYASMRSLNVFSELQAHPHSEILDTYLSTLEDANLILYSIYTQNPGLKQGLSSPGMIPGQGFKAGSKTCSCHTDKKFLWSGKLAEEPARIENLLTMLQNDKNCYLIRAPVSCNALSRSRVMLQSQEESQLSLLLSAQVFTQLKARISQGSYVTVPIIYSMNELIMVENSISLLNTIQAQLSRITNLALLNQIHHEPYYRQELLLEIEAFSGVQNHPLFQNSDLPLVMDKTTCFGGNCGMLQFLDQINKETQLLKSDITATDSGLEFIHFYQVQKQFHDTIVAVKASKLKDFNYHFNEVYEQISFYEHLYNNFLLLAFLAMVSGIILSYIMVKPILSSISKLKSSIDTVKTGNFNITFDEIGKDEISELKIAFMKMSQALKEREDELISRNKELAEMQASLIQSSKLSAIGMLSTGIAHELNQPLMVINSYIDLLKDEFQNNLKISDDITILKKQIEKMKSIILQLSDFSRTDSKTAAVNINKIIDNVLVFTTTYFKKHSIEIIREYTEPLPAVTVYQSQIEQVFLNMLTNAVDGIRPKQQGIITIKTAAPGNREIIITITDNGMGIAQEALDKIFEPFYTTKEPGSGTGLGLYVSYKIIQAHHGSISVTSREGQGAQFIITLPVVPISEGPEDGKTGRQADSMTMETE